MQTDLLAHAQAARNQVVPDPWKVQAQVGGAMWLFMQSPWPAGAAQQAPLAQDLSVPALVWDT